MPWQVAAAGVNALAGLFQQNENKKMMREQMAYGTKEREASQAFTSSEREAQQAYQTGERTAQNDWSEYMYNQYQSPEALRRQYSAAGFDPSLAISGNAAPAVSSGSSGGAPSGASSTPSHLTPPYQNMNAFASGFSDIANALKSLGEAEKLGVDTKFLKDTFEERVKAAKMSPILQSLVINEKKLNNRNIAKAYDKIITEIESGKAKTREVEANINLLVHEGAIKKQEADTFMEKFRNEQNHIISQTNLNDSQSTLNTSQTELINLMKVTESTKPALNRVLTSLYSYQSESARVASEIANATEYSEVVAIRNRNFKTLEKIESEIGSLNAQAELALRNRDYSTWDKINQSFSALGSLGFLFILGKNAVKKAAPVLSAPAGAFTPQFNNPSDLNTYGQGQNIWY